jgi:hypothetical protein
MLPMQPGLPERRTHDYKRHSTSEPGGAELGDQDLDAIGVMPRT